jgi:hypothetical protein
MMRSFSLRTRAATCSKRASVALAADFACEAALPVLRLLRADVPLEPDPVDREPLAREPLERELLARDPLERVPLDRVPPERELLERALLREPDERLEPLDEPLDEPPEERRDPEPPDDEPDPEPPLLACGTSPPLPGQQWDVDTTFRRARVGRFREAPGC